MANPEFRAAGAITSLPSGSGAINVPVPSGTTDGDYVFCIIVSVAGSGTPNSSPPVGFGSPLISVANNLYAGGYRIWGKIASSEGSDYSIEESGGGPGAYAFTVAYSNPGASPINTSATLPQSSSVTSIPMPEVTNTVAGKLIGFAYENQGRAPTYTAAGNYTLRTSRTSSPAFAWADEEVSGTGSALTGRTLTASPTGNFLAASIFLAASGGGPNSIPLITHLARMRRS